MSKAAPPAPLPPCQTLDDIKGWTVFCGCLWILVPLVAFMTTVIRPFVFLVLLTAAPAMLATTLWESLVGLPAGGLLPLAVAWCVQIFVLWQVGLFALGETGRLHWRWMAATHLILFALTTVLLWDDLKLTLLIAP